MQIFDPRQIHVSSGHFIGGRLIPDVGRMVVRRPSDGQPHAELPLADAATVDTAVRDAYSAWRVSDWARRPPRERARVLRRWAELVEVDAARLGPLEAVCSTRPVRDVIAWDVPFTAEGLRFFAEYADKLGGEVAATRQDHLGMVVAEPYGVVGAITPWNFPLVMVSWKVGAALAAGNAVVLKPSELTPYSAVRLAELAVEAGVPAGLFNIVQGTGAITGDALSRHPLISKMTFTGSTRTGSAIMAACALTGPKPVTLELGGKSPQLVFDDAPGLERLAGMITDSIIGNAGQVCVAGTRLIVQNGIAEALVERIAARLASARPGATWEDNTTLPPMISASHAERILNVVNRARDAGARVRCGGDLHDGGPGGAYFQPTLIERVSGSNPAVQEEIFGPVLTVQTFADEEEGLALAAHEHYGLAAGVHTADIGRALRAMRGISAGTIWINRYGRSADFVIPTGGFHQSGIGKDLGRQAVESNLRFKSVLIDFGAAH
ncbi:aldehyde dehydrogenase family protein [Variovorax sp. NFACC27]|uniref:aldehyde dehydrogenase family protein n=1 Tax=unclassified Variovorax TaxID=663243 RepID=UPI00089728AE|nr:aldehyde dehydrogenase (NAD+) [Variovorax sp. NFACC28]SEG09922.1 aldehyde dehydrogenase (NAD+) [Variovorax sp. NFACC29]SFC04200.1 aldehyde dehydrogenase (NAD+) [Variovorax sp. NFACC26]SFF77402.1 aldehyde dehydrogenase (NAD+) [Variovorax sp. NFACC27]